MKHQKLFVHFLLMTAWLAVNLACGGSSSKQANAVSSNVGGNNNSSAAGETANDTTAATKSDVKNLRFCMTLTDFVNGEYTKNSFNSKCEGKKTLKLPSGRTQELLFTGEGEAENVKNVGVRMVTKTEFKDNAEAEGEFLKTCEQLYFEAFRAVVPAEIRNTMLADKGKATEKIKSYKDPGNVTFIRHRTGGTDYGLSFRFDLPKQ